MSCDEIPVTHSATCQMNIFLEYEKQFVIAFGKLPVLWNRRHPNYFNKYKRIEALEKLLMIYRKVKPHAKVGDVKKKINSLRSNYRRDLRKMMMYKDSGGDYVPKSWVFKYLNFLSEEELSEANEQDPLDLDYPDHDEEHLKEEYLQPSCSLSPAENTLQSSSFSSDGPLVTSDYGPEHQTYYPPKRKYTETDEPMYQVEPITNTLALYWTEKLEKLDNTQRIYAEKAINDILCEAELGNLNRYSVRINVSSKSD